ncbi:MAG: ATP-dependent helicase, partial [Marinobacter sp.]
AMVIRCAGVTLSVNESKLRMTYHGEDGEELSESFDFSKPAQCTVFNKLFGRRFANGRAPKTFNKANEVLESQALLPAPDFVIARKQKHYWQVQERVFDYQGSYRKANET